MKDIRKRIVNLILFSLYICTAFYVNMKADSVKVMVPAGCPSCLCMEAPTCGDVAIIERGTPFVNKRLLSGSEYVEEPYLSRYGGEEYNRHYFLAYVGNTLVVTIVYFGVYKVISKITRARK